MLGLTKKAFRRLEPDDGKLSSPVLRGRRERQRSLCYPTAKKRLPQRYMRLLPIVMRVIRRISYGITFVLRLRNRKLSLTKRRRMRHLNVQLPNGIALPMRSAVKTPRRPTTR